MIRNTNLKNLYKGFKIGSEIQLSIFNKINIKSYTGFYSSDFSETKDKKSNYFNNIKYLNISWKASEIN